MSVAIAECQAGRYFVARNPTPGTAIVFAVADAISETAANFLAIKNNSSPGASTEKKLILDYIRLICGVAPASGTAGYFYTALNSNAAKYTSGGSELTPVQPNMNETGTSAAKVYAGALTTIAAAATARIVAGGVLRTAIPVVGDEWVLKYGADAIAAYSLLGGTATLRMLIPCPPVILGPQQVATLQMWFPSNASTPSQFEVEAGWWEV
jgi:hypothetical protein